MDPIAGGLEIIRRLAARDPIALADRVEVVQGVRALRAAIEPIASRPSVARLAARLDALLAAIREWQASPDDIASLARACAIPVVLDGGGDPAPPAPVARRMHAPLGRAVALAVGGGARADSYPGDLGVEIELVLRELLAVDGVVVAFVLDARGHLLAHVGDPDRAPPFAAVAGAHRLRPSDVVVDQDGRGIQIVSIDSVILAVLFELPCRGLDGEPLVALSRELSRVVSGCVALPPLGEEELAALFDE